MPAHQGGNKKDMWPEEGMAEREWKCLLDNEAETLTAESHVTQQPPQN